MNNIKAQTHITNPLEWTRSLNSLKNKEGNVTYQIEGNLYKAEMQVNMKALYSPFILEVGQYVRRCLLVMLNDDNGVYQKEGNQSSLQ